MMTMVTMANWWKTDPNALTPEPARVPAVAYYLHSAQDRQENSIPIQRDQVREWAEKNGVSTQRASPPAAKI